MPSPVPPAVTLRTNSYFLSPTGCRIWIGAKGHRGYGRITVGYKCFLAHRLAWIVANGDIPDGMFVCHRCDTPECIEPEHLFLGTCADNAADMAAKGRSTKGKKYTARVYGSASYLSKLTEADIPLIRADPRTQQAIADSYGVTQSNITMIKNYRSWKHVK